MECNLKFFLWIITLRKVTFQEGNTYSTLYLIINKSCNKLCIISICNEYNNIICMFIIKIVITGL